MDNKDELDNDNNNNNKQEGMTMRTILTMILQTMMRASDMMKYIYLYVFMTGNDRDLGKEWTMKTTWTMTTTTTKIKEIMKRKNMLTMILQMTMRASNMMKYIYPYVFMTGNNDDLDKEWTMKMTWTMITTTTIRKEITKRKNMLTMILQTMMRASNMMKYIYPHVFMTGNDDNLDNEWTMKTIGTTTTTNKME